MTKGRTVKHADLKDEEFEGDAAGSAPEASRAFQFDLTSLAQRNVRIPAR